LNIAGVHYPLQCANLQIKYQKMTMESPVRLFGGTLKR